MQLLHQLDAKVAAKLGLAPPEEIAITSTTSLLLEQGRMLYEEHLKRPRVAGGVRATTSKRYRPVFDKFVAFAKGRGILCWNAVTRHTLDAYASHLDREDYVGKTQCQELTVVIQAHKWLMEEKHVVGVEPLRLTMRKVEGERAYCYTTPQVEAMVKHCRSLTAIGWLAGVIIALACTGLRISELASLRWSDVDLARRRLVLTDESGRSRRNGRARRELKSGRSRHLPLHPDLEAVLAGLNHVDPFIFHGPRGARLKPDTVRLILIREVIEPLARQFPSSGDEQGFKDGRLHSFRHYFASTCATNGVSERVAMDWSGHQDSAMVRHYFHLNDAESRQQMERLKPPGEHTGERLPGVEKAAESKKPQEVPSRRNPAIAS